MRYYYLGSRLLCSPLEALYTILIFILSKELNVAIWHLTLMACVKPMVSLLSFYISSFIVSKPSKIRKYLLAVNAMGCLPCLLFPWMQDPLLFIASYAIFMTTQRAAYPIWVELLKNNLSIPQMGTIVSRGTSINYTSIMFLPVLISPWLDQIWQVLFVGLGLLQMCNTLLIAFLPIYKEVAPPQLILSPFKSAWSLLRENRAFSDYLIVFFLGGAGIIAMQPILPAFFKENLGLTYTQLTLAFSFCKGISFICTSPFWAKLVKSISLYRLNAYMTIFTGLFILSILLSPIQVNWLFFGYLMYGAMQAGCEMSWNLSGPIFSNGKESTFYSSVNLGLVGIRGCICPLLGQLIFSLSNATAVFTFCLSICLFACFYALSCDRKKEVTSY